MNFTKPDGKRSPELLIKSVLYSLKSSVPALRLFSKDIWISAVPPALTGCGATITGCCAGAVCIGFTVTFPIADIPGLPVRPPQVVAYFVRVRPDAAKAFAAQVGTARIRCP